MLRCRLPVVAAVNGPAVGLGCSVIALSDVVYLAESAYLSDPHVTVGLVAADGGPLTWPLHTSLLLAKEYAFTGDRISATRAREIGLANHVLPDDEMFPAALATAHKIAKLPKQAVEATKRVLNLHAERAVLATIDFAMASETESFDTDDLRANVDRFLGRSPSPDRRPDRVMLPDAERVTVADYRTALHAWLDEHREVLAPRYAPPGTLDEQVAQMQRVKALLFEADWMRYGWPERVGGLGGSPMLRTELGAAIAGRDLTDPGLYSLVEVLAPTLIDYAPPELAAEVVPRLLSGAEMWCQGFSEPGTGSDLSSLTCRAQPDGDAATASTWIINGQKVWTSLAQYSERCVLLTRTGPPDSRHRGITAFFVDMDSPGISVAPLEMINGMHEFAEVFFDDVVVPADRMLGELHGGWAVAMSILPYERSSCFWQRIAYLYRRLQLLVEAAPDDDRTAEVVGDAFVQLHALRARSRATQHRLAAGATLGAETSIDKVLVATAEQAVYDAARRLLPGVVELDDSVPGATWRSEYLYSRAATIYGGTAEVQRNIIARRLLELGDE